MRVAEYIAKSLVEAGVTDVFMVTGGAAMHLNDAFGAERGLRVTCFHHEQAAAMAAESYFRFTNQLAVVNVTAGPGATNAITGVAGGHLDSLGMLVISGQVKRATLRASTELPLRQLGDQEIDITAMVASITKHARLVEDPLSIRYELEKSLHLATTGRPGACWLDVPVDVQAAQVEEGSLVGFDPALRAEGLPGEAQGLSVARRLHEMLCCASRPVVYAGAGIRLARAEDSFIQLVESWGLPVVTSLNGHDLLPAGHRCLVGRPGTIGDRAGNFAVNSADLVVVMGTRMGIRQVGYDWSSFAPRARVAMVDIDASELHKPTFRVDEPLHADLRHVLPRLAGMQPTPGPGVGSWLSWCISRAQRYPVVQTEHTRVDEPANPYAAIRAIVDAAPGGTLVVCGNGWAGVGSAQAARLRPGMRMYSNSSMGSMGHDLPASIGAALSRPGSPVLCITGDGSLQMNIQELQTLVHHQLPVCIAVIANGGYHSIRQTQERFFPATPVGFDAGTGLSLPDLGAIAAAYGIPFRRTASLTSVGLLTAKAFESGGPFILEVVVDRAQGFAPKASSKLLADGSMVSPPLHDMAPFLDPEELRENVLEEVHST